MRQGPNSRRSRGRGSSNNPGRRSNLPNRNQTFDSNGPDVRIRGNAHQVHEKYLALARDASASGDRVMAENYLQHAEHYHRIISAINEAYNQAQQQQFEQANRGGDQSEREDGREAVPNGRDGRRDAGGREEQVPQQQRHRESGQRDERLRDGGQRGGGRRDRVAAGDLFEDPRQSDDQEFQPGAEAGPARRDNGAARAQPEEGLQKPGARENGAVEGTPREEGRGRKRGEDRVGLDRIIRAPVSAPAEQRAEAPSEPAAEATAEEAPKPRRRPGRPRKTVQPTPDAGGDPAAE